MNQLPLLARNLWQILQANTSVVCRSNTKNIQSATIPEQSTNLAIRADMRGNRGLQSRVMPGARKMSIISPVSFWQTYIHRFVIGQ